MLDRVTTETNHIVIRGLMKSSDRLFVALVHALVAALFTLTGCGSSVELTSVQRTIVVDGDNADWANIPTYVEKKKLSVSICNDDQFAYVCLTSQDRATQMEIMRAGLTVWFDREGGTDKYFGINFPLGGTRNGPPSTMNDDEMNPPEPMQHTLESQMSELEILGPKKNDRYRLSIVSASGIQVKVGRSRKETMVYELRVPLQRSTEHPYAIEAMNGKHIGIGFETGELAVPHSRSDGDFGGGRGGGMPPGGGHGGGERPSGRGRGGMQSGAEGKSDPIDLWTVVTLSGNT